MSSFPGEFPRTRLRRNRKADWCRRLVSEVSLQCADLIWPVFVQEGRGKSTPVAAMPGVVRYSLDRLLPEVEAAVKLGIPAIALFPVVPAERKSLDAKEAYREKNLVCQAIRAIKKEGFPLGVIADVALDPYTAHGHDGLVKEGKVDNDATLKVLARQAVAQARAGCDVIAPSDMMDGRIGVVRDALDKEGFTEVSILSYAAKYASGFYGPFREAVGSKQQLGKADKKTYQMDPANAREALREVALDIQEGADMVMVKPGLPYLDVIGRISDEFAVPVLAYQVSGEYAMVHVAAEKGWLDAGLAMEESLLAMKRAGASAILTYAAREMAPRCRA